MAADFIKIIRNDSAATHAPKLLSAIAQVRAAKASLDEIRAIGFRCFDGSDFSVFEGLFGIPTGKGGTIFDLINGTTGALEGTMQNANSVELVNRVG